MPKQTVHVGVVREWCVSLGVLTAVSISRQEAEMKLAAYVPMLLQRFDDAAFTSASLQHVAARALKGFPTYPELADWLGDWWRDHQPIRPALPPPPPLPFHQPTPEEMAYIHERVEEITAALAASNDAKSSVEFGARHLSPGVLDQINPLPNGRKRVLEGAP